ncbi:D-alanyl-D-alanine carboxypeptidase [Evansella sp. AB-P1]|uniref:D-alanyl-D-alanine carboxypeptidase family protein n=1 Tax=Evansella sp. AB-P1 TaxID=3037653 RepID=UPI00241C96C8|nr:D-alanyl-D-alanine carboxypeptidase family protein [Evansella sp. AB-P1]MDG5790126.1 D-alanyl-D-alanine carboxypeptidase [Evansella sp. AB-P1]
MLKKLGLISFIFTFSFMSIFPFINTASANIDTIAEGAIIVDAETGKILYEKNIDTPLIPASMVKMMTEYLILEAVENGDISWDQIVPISSELAALSHDENLSNVMLRVDEQYTVRDLYESVAIYSANASTMALGELIAGSYSRFIEMMNEKGKEIGMGTLLREEGEKVGLSNLDEIASRGIGDFQFVNSTGLSNHHLDGNHPEGTGENEDNYMSVRATAILAYRLLNDYPEVLDTQSIPDKWFKEGTEDQILMENWNWMLPGSIEPQHDYEYVDGLKTGSLGAGFISFTGTGIKDGQRLITVVMGLQERAQRFNETERLMEFGFNNFHREEIFPAEMVLEGYETIPVVNGTEDEVSISTTDAVSALIYRGEEESYTYSIQFDEDLLDDEGRLEAPIEANQVIGKMIVEYTGSGEEKYLEDTNPSSRQVDIVTNEAVERAGWFSLMIRNIGGFFSGLWGSIADTFRGWL